MPDKSGFRKLASRRFAVTENPVYQDLALPVTPP
jgi:hypothetical protein